MNFQRLLTRTVACIGLVLACGGHAFGAELRIAGAACTAPMAEPAEAVEPQSGRKFFLDFPCDLKPGEKVNFILSLHGASGTGAGMLQYFPAGDYKEKYRLVVATPTSATASRIWNGATDDIILQHIVDLVFENFGKASIKTFWLAGHSQGGITGTRLVCTPFFKSKADGLMSLSGGRVGKVEMVPGFFGPPPPGITIWPPVASGPDDPDCDFSYIYVTGGNEVTGLPETSPLAQRYVCGPRVRKADIVDIQPQPASQGRFGRSGTAEVFVFPKCGDGRLVADVLRQNKNHGDGLEPKLTDSLIGMMLAAPRGKAQAK